MSHVLAPMQPPPALPSHAEEEDPAERTARALRDMAGSLVSKKSARALLKERNMLRDQVKALEEKTNAVWLVQRNRLLQQELAEADKGGHGYQLRVCPFCRPEESNLAFLS